MDKNVSVDEVSVVLSWDEVFEKYVNLIKWKARQTYLKYPNIDASLSAEDFYQYGLIKLYDCWNRYNDRDMKEFGKLFKTALQREMVDRVKLSMTVDSGESDDENEEVSELDRIAAPGDMTEEFNNRETIDEITRKVSSPLSRAILSEILDPSPRTIFEVWADKARKRELKAQGKNVNIPKKTDIKMKHIRAALGVKPKEFDIGILEIREIARNLI